MAESETRARHRGQPGNGVRAGGAGRAAGPAAGRRGPRSTTARRRSPTCRAAFESVAARPRGARDRASTTRPSRSSRRPPSSPATRGCVKAAGKQLAAGQRPRHARSTTRSRSMPRSSRRSAATSPSGSPTCATSAPAPSPRLLGVAGTRACPPSPSRASSSREDLAPAETATLDRRHGRRHRHRGRRPHQPHRDPRRPDGDPRRRAARGRDRASRPARPSRSTATPARSPSTPTWRIVDAPSGQRAARRARGARAGSSGPGATSRRRPRGAARQHRRRRGRRRRRRPGRRGRRAVPHRVRLPLRDKAPTVDEQTEIYRDVFAPFEGRRVVVRTLDAGADKPLAFADLGPEENPALGRRGLRLSAERPDLLDAQLEALAIAAKETGADVRVMAPMVATAEEAAWFARRVRENGLPKVGVMIEVPGAALRSAPRARRGRLRQPRHQRPGAVHHGRRPDAGRPVRPARPVAAGACSTSSASACEGRGSPDRRSGSAASRRGDPLLALVLVGLGVS